MNLVTPDSGLLFWMVLIFAILFFLLWKFGFPVITGMVDKRNDNIDKSLARAREAEERMLALAEEQSALLEKTSREQNEMIREATRTRERILEDARTQADAEADMILRKARKEIENEKENALREIRNNVAELSVAAAEKILRQSLDSDKAQMDYVTRLLDEVSKDK